MRKINYPANFRKIVRVTSSKKQSNLPGNQNLGPSFCNRRCRRCRVTDWVSKIVDKKCNKTRILDIRRQILGIFQVLSYTDFLYQRSHWMLFQGNFSTLELTDLDLSKLKNSIYDCVMQKTIMHIVEKLIELYFTNEWIFLRSQDREKKTNQSEARKCIPLLQKMHRKKLRPFFPNFLREIGLCQGYLEAEHF